MVGTSLFKLNARAWPANFCAAMLTMLPLLLATSLASAEPKVAAEVTTSESTTRDTPEAASERSDNGDGRAASSRSSTSPGTEAPDFETFLSWQASAEIEIGLRLFDEGDDYRAITSLKRFRLLSGTG